MNSQVATALAEWVGALAVVASLLYLASQIRQNTRALRAAAHESSVNLMRDVNHHLLQGNLGRVFVTGCEDWDALTEDERIKFAVLALDLLKTFENVHYHHLQGTMEAGVWAGWHEFIREYCTAPGIRRYWSMRQHCFSPAFRELFASFDPSQPRLRLSHLATATAAELV
ncbi:MAG: hypothetical protein ACT4O1_01260 [Gemmatimonadota bacterium]